MDFFVSVNIKGSFAIFSMMYLEKKFAKFMVNLLKELPDDCIQQVFEDQSSVGYDSVDDFCSSFLSSKCKHYVNFHDEKLCTVEFTCKIVTTLEVVTSLSEELVQKLHLDIQTPVGSVQV